MRPLVWLAALAVATLAGAAEAVACSCGGGSGPPCEEAWRADAVIDGTVRSIVEIGHDAYGASRRSLLVTFDVHRVFVNAVPGPIEVITASLGSSCGYEFAAGQRYLVYASKTPIERLSVSLCSRTRPLGKAQEDLQYLSSLPPTGSGARVFGRVHHWQRDPFEERAVDYGPLEGLVVNVTGAGYSRNTVTDASGRYEVAGLPAGPATLTVTAPHGFDSHKLERELELRDPRACSERNFELRYVARASGSVVDAAGRPRASIRIEAVAAELAGHQPPPYQEAAITDERGTFEFGDLPPGTYVFGINLTRPRYGRATDGPAVFLPGTRTAAEAAVIVLNPGDQKEVGALRLDER